MNKEQAKQAAMGGNKVTHSTFLSDEYVHVVNEKFYDESMIELDWDYFWDSRTQEKWQNNWSVFNE
jgi:hypothetical protein